MGENEWKISLGVDIDVDDLQTQINIAGNKVKPIPIKVEIENFDEIKKQLQNLGGTKGNTKVAIPIDTATIEGALKEVSVSIKEIKNAIGTLDSKSGMKSLLSSINQINSALDKASDKFAELNGNLSALANKDFNINFGINMGGSNQIGRNAAYGSKVRNETLPQLKQQMGDLVKYYNDIYKSSLGEFEVLQRLVSGTKLNSGDFFESFLFGKDSVASRMSGGSLASQMQAYKQYIDMFKQAAGLKGLDISHITSQFSKSADQLVQDAVDVQTGANEMQDGFEKLRQIFGGGNNFNVEGLSQQLDSIVGDLKEIKVALTDLSTESPINQLKQSFDQLSQSLNEFLSNINVVRNTLDNGLNASISNGETERAVQAQEELIQTSAQATNAIVQNEEKKQQAYRETADALDQVSKVKIGNTELDALNLKDEIDDADKLAAALSKLKNIQTNIGKIKIGEIDTSKGVQEIQTLENQLESLSAEYNETVAEINSMGGVSKTQWQAIQNQVDTTNVKLDQLKSKIDDAKTKLAQKIKLGLNDGDFNVMSRINAETGKLTGVYPKLEAGIREVERAIRDMEAAAGTGNEVADVEKLISAHERYEHALKNVNNQLKANLQTEKNNATAQKLNDDIVIFQNKIDAYLTKNSAAAKQFGSQLMNLKIQAQNCDRVTLNHLESEFKQIDKAAEAAGLKTKTFGDSLKAQFSKYSSYLSVASMFTYIWQGLRDMFRQVVAIDTAMTELKKVTDETDASYNKFLSNAAKRSKELGTTIDGLVESTADFARLGYGFEDSQELAEVANIYAVVGDEIEGVDEATQSLVSTLAAYKDEASGISDTDFAMDIVDKFNEVSNNFAISSGGIGEAMQRSASSLRAANNTIDESIALITAANTVVQDPTVIGTSFKTISMRIRGKFVPIYNENYSLCYAV